MSEFCSFSAVWGRLNHLPTGHMVSRSHRCRSDKGSFQSTPRRRIMSPVLLSTEWLCALAMMGEFISVQSHRSAMLQNRDLERSYARIRRPDLTHLAAIARGDREQFFREYKRWKPYS